MASIEDVARRAGVSPITASRVVRSHPNVTPATRERVQRAIAELNYIPNGVARGLRQSRSGLIALIITDITSPFFTAVARGAEDAARAAGMKLILGNSDDDAEIEAEYLRSMGEHRVDGVVLVPTEHARQALGNRLPKTMPIVLLDRGVAGVEADLVRCDTGTATRELCRHLWKLGRRRIAIVGGAPSSPTWYERVDGYRAALGEAGYVPSDDLVVPGDYTPDAGGEAVRHLLALSPPPDAIIAANAQVAHGVLDALVAHGRRVPDDIAVAAIDDPLPPSAFWPRLTVVEQPGYEMGKAAVDLILSRLAHPRTQEPARELVFPATLKIGVSCGEEARVRKGSEA
jgi:LacI family transcriptional regulator